MADKTHEKLSFFEYMALAKQELLSIQAEHPELAKLSPREIEVFAYLLTDKTQEEIADVLEVLMAIADARGYKWSDILAIQEKKREERGGFAKKILLVSTEED